MAMEGIKNKLFTSVMQGKWDEVVKIYVEHEEAHKTKITTSGDTALHVAVSDDQALIVEQLLRIIRRKGKVNEVLEIQNEKGNTCLHLAASMGSVKMCMDIASTHPDGPDLIGTRNRDSETPLFLAALNGKKEAFLCLDKICGSDKGTTYSRKKNGDTILHCAISEDYFDLAFQIICRYNNLANSVNKQGLSPLHLLATKHSCFKSGSHFGWFTNIIYHCILVEKLKVETIFKWEKDLIKAPDEERNPSYPVNYQTCINILQLPLSALKILFHPGNRPSTNFAQAHQKATDTNTGKDPRTGGQADLEDPSGNQSNIKAKRLESQGHQLFPSNYHTCFDIFKFVSKAVLIILRLGFKGIRKIQEKKQKHVWAAQIMDLLLCHASLYEYQDNAGNIPKELLLKKDNDETLPYLIFESPYLLEGMAPQTSSATNQQGENKEESYEGNKETPILIAAKSGVVEMVQEILERFPVAIQDVDHQEKNVVLLAVEHRQPHVYELLLKSRSVIKDTAFRRVDIDGNSALHLVAKFVDSGPYPFAAVQMQWEIKWYQYVKNSVPRHHFIRYNKKGKTAKQIFRESHQELASKGGEWLNNISNSCSVVATLITGVSFATTATTPGGIKENSSRPNFQRHPGFLVYAVSSLISLAFSVTSVVTFLSILTARRSIKDFDTMLPLKLLLGFTCLFISIAAMLVCFCGAHYFLLKDVLEDDAFTVYALASLPVTIFAVAQFPLYFVLLWTTFQTVPQRRMIT